jgi:SOS-response transcriptional repressor LexA
MSTSEAGREDSLWAAKGERVNQVAQRLQDLISETMQTRFPGRKVQASDFAELCQIPDTSLRNYLNAKSIPGGENLARISAATGVSVDWILTGQGLRFREGNLMFPQSGASGSEAEVVADIVMLPVLNGVGKIPYVAISKSWLEQHIQTELTTLTVAQVMGDSMEPTLSRGDLVIVDESQRDLEQIIEGLYLLRVDHILRVRRLEARKRKIRVLSDNSSYGPEVFTFTSFLKEFQVLGRVRGCLRSLS